MEVEGNKNNLKRDAWKLRIGGAVLYGFGAGALSLGLTIGFREAGEIAHDNHTTSSASAIFKRDALILAGGLVLAKGGGVMADRANILEAEHLRRQDESSDTVTSRSASA